MSRERTTLGGRAAVVEVIESTEAAPATTVAQGKRPRPATVCTKSPGAAHHDRQTQTGRRRRISCQLSAISVRNLTCLKLKLLVQSDTLSLATRIQLVPAGYRVEGVLNSSMPRGRLHDVRGVLIELGDSHPPRVQFCCSTPLHDMTRHVLHLPPFLEESYLPAPAMALTRDFAAPDDGGCLIASRLGFLPHPVFVAANERPAPVRAFEERACLGTNLSMNLVLTDGEECRARRPVRLEQL